MRQAFCLYDDAYTVTVAVTDDNGGTASATLTVTVLNVAPTVDAGLDVPAILREEVSISAVVFNDLGTLDTHSATIDWGDGTTSVGAVTESPFGRPGSTSGANGTVSGSYVPPCSHCTSPRGFSGGLNLRSNSARSAGGVGLHRPVSDRLRGERRPAVRTAGARVGGVHPRHLCPRAARRAGESGGGSGPYPRRKEGARTATDERAPCSGLGGSRRQCSFASRQSATTPEWRAKRGQPSGSAMTLT